MPNKLSIFASAFVVWCAAGCASTQKIEMFNHMAMCDGFGYISDTADGATKIASDPWIGQLSLSRKQRVMGSGKTSCDSAIATVDTSYPQHQARKVSLLQSRALHSAAKGIHDSAIADIDIADTILKKLDDTYLKRSLGLNNHLVRAYILSQSGKQEEADALGLEVIKQRPYSRNAAIAVLIATGPNSLLTTKEEVLQTLAKIYPSYSDRYFFLIFESGRYDLSLDVFLGLESPRPVYDATSDKTSKFRRKEKQRAVEAIFAIKTNGRRAYALAALGQTEKAKSTLDDATRAWQKAIVKIPDLSSESSTFARTKNIVIEEVNRDIQLKAPELLEFWTKVVSARIALNKGRLSEASNLVEKIKLLDSTSKPFQIRSEIAQKKGGYSGDDFTSQMDVFHSLLGLPDQTPQDLFKNLFDAETEERTTENLNVLDGLFMGKEKKERGGCEEYKTPDLQLSSICYKSKSGTLAISEEQAILRVAQKANQAGATHFEIERRNDIKHEFVNFYAGPVDAGMESQLQVRFYKDLEDPSDCWRCLNTEEVIKNLSPLLEDADN